MQVLAGSSKVGVGRVVIASQAGSIMVGSGHLSVAVGRTVGSSRARTIAPSVTMVMIRWSDVGGFRTATTLGWWDGTQMQVAVPKGWWDGTAIQPIRTG